MNFPSNLHACIQHFSDPKVAHDFMVSIRWPEGVRCPNCDSQNVGFVATRFVFQCKECPKKKQFTVKVGTIMEQSPIGLNKWLCAMWMICNAKNGVSSYEIHRSLGITQKSAWFLMHRIRLALKSGSIEKFKGEVEVDETFIGGKSKFMHRHKKKKQSGWKGMTPVQGILERNPNGAARVKVQLIRNTKKANIQKIIRDNVEPGSEVYTDALLSYQGLDDVYTHGTVDHAIFYVKGKAHTNSLENFWSLLKRTIKGTYICIKPFHLLRYLDEQSFRFNERLLNDAQRFLKTVSGAIGKRLTYEGLITREFHVQPWRAV